MKKHLLFVTLLLSCLTMATQSHARKNFGLGVILFGPTGISGNYTLSKKESIDAALAFDIGDHLNVHTTYLRHYRRGLRVDDLRLNWYWGLGVRFKTIDKNNETRFGGRASLGIDHFVSKKVPIQVFGELSFIMDVIEKTAASFDVGIGARYYF